MTIWLYTGHILGEYVPEGGFTVIRSTFPALRSSVMRDFTEYLFALGIYQYIDHRKTFNEFHYKGRHVDFIPADNPQKIRGRKSHFAWLEEINDIDYDIFTQVNIRLIHRMFMTVNPTGTPWGKTQIEDIRIKAIGDVYLDVSTFRDNPFLEQSIIDEIEKLKFLDEDLYQIYNLGIWTKLKGLIYPEIEIIESLPKKYIEETFGLDFGFTHPAAFVRTRRTKEALYFDEVFNRRDMQIPEMAAIIKSFKPSKVICDSSEPRSIAELRSHRINASPAKKGADSVKQGIGYIKQHKIYVTSRSLGMIEEVKKYKWGVNLQGVLTEKPVKEYDDSLDAARYSINRALGGKMRLL